jgi:hypothetical protein
LVGVLRPVWAFCWRGLVYSSGAFRERVKERENSGWAKSSLELLAHNFSDRFCLAKLNVYAFKADNYYVEKS